MLRKGECSKGVDDNRLKDAALSFRKNDALMRMKCGIGNQTPKLDCSLKLQAKFFEDDSS